VLGSSFAGNGATRTKTTAKCREAMYLKLDWSVKSGYSGGENGYGVDKRISRDLRLVPNFTPKHANCAKSWPARQMQQDVDKI
jgi:hypothetical protein